MRRLMIMALLLSGCAVTPVPSMADVSVQQVEQVERDLVLPDGADALDLYARAWWMEGGVLVGFFVKPDMVGGLKAGRRLLQASPPYDVMDGGCGVIHVRADAGSGRIESVTCNGES